MIDHRFPAGQQLHSNSLNLKRWLFAQTFELTASSDTIYAPMANKIDPEIRS